jgi:hypothetical protein
VPEFEEAELEHTLLKVDDAALEVRIRRGKYETAMLYMSISIPASSK